jgi:hypothetical protein
MDKNFEIVANNLVYRDISLDNVRLPPRICLCFNCGHSLCNICYLEIKERDNKCPECRQEIYFSTKCKELNSE